MTNEDIERIHRISARKTAGQRMAQWNRAMTDRAKRIFEQEIADGVIHGATILALDPYGEEIRSSWGWAAGIGTFNAGLFSTAEDLAKLMRVYLRGGVCDGVTRLFGEAEMAEIAPLKTCRTEGARSFGWQYADGYLPKSLSGTALFHSGWSGQTVLFDLKRKRAVVVLTTRCGDYDRAKRERFEAIATILD